MKPCLLLLIVLTVGWTKSFSQTIPDLTRYKTTREKLEALADLCDELAVKEDFNQEKAVSLYAMKLAPANDAYYRSIFLYNLGYVYESSSTDSSIFYHELSLSEARKAKTPSRIRMSLERLLYSYNNTSRHQHKSDRTLKELLASIDTTKNEYKKATLYATIGNYYSSKGQYETQINYLLKAVAIKKKLIAAGKIKDREDIVVELVSLGELYNELQQGEKGIAYLNEARSYIVSYPPYISQYYKDICGSYLLLKQPAKAKVYYDSLRTMFEADKESDARRSTIIAVDLTFADYYLTNNKPDSAESYASRATNLAKNWADEFLMAQVNYINGTLFLAQKKYEKALPLLKASEPNSAGFGLQVHVGLLQSLAKCYAATGQWQQAYAYYDKYAPLRDSLYLESSRKSIADAEAQYQNKDKQQQIEVKNLQIDRAKKERIWLISGLLLLVLSLLLLGIIYRNKRKNAEVLNQKNQELARLIGQLEESNRTKAKLFSIISHDLRSPISQVYQFLKLQQLNPRLLNESQKAELSERIQTATGSLLETMEDLLLWSKTQMNQFQADIQPVNVAQIVSQSLRLLQLNIEAKNLMIDNAVSSEIIVSTDPYYLQAIIRNLLQNAVKASDEGGIITLGTLPGNAQITLFIENSGPAFTQAAYETILSQKDNGQGLSGLGLRLVDELSEQTELKVTFENPTENITRTLIRFPI